MVIIIDGSYKSFYFSPMISLPKHNAVLLFSLFCRVFEMQELSRYIVAVRELPGSVVPTRSNAKNKPAGELG